MTFINEKSELIKCDTSAISDKFGWIEEVRGLDLQMLDLENKSEEIKESLAGMKEILAKVETQGRRQREIVNNLTGTSALMADVNHGRELTKLKNLKIQYKAVKEICDSMESDLKDAEDKLNAFECTPSDDPDTVTDNLDYNKIHWAYVRAEWETIYTFLMFKGHKLTDSYCAFLYDVIDEKLARREITMQYYISIARHLALRLKWSDELNRIAKIKATYESKWVDGKQPEEPFEVSLEDRYFGEMTCNEDELIRAIEIRDAAKRCGCSVYDFMND